MASVRKRGDSWHVQVRRKGAPPLTRSFSHRRQAERWARETESSIDQSRLPPNPKALDGITLGDLVRRYRDTVSPRKRRAAIERIELNAFLRHPMCAKRLSELSTADFAAYRDQRLAEVRPTTVKRQLGPIRHLFRIAEDEWGLPIRDNPLSKLRLHAPDQRRNRRLQAGELDRLIIAARRSRNKLILPIILLALETGMRRGELLAVQRSDIDLDQRLLHIPRSKNGQPRTIPLTTNAIALLQPIAGVEGRLLPVTANAFRLAWERLRRRAGMPDLHFHDLRHEAISRFFEKGLTVPEVALLSGHRDPRMLFRYAHAMRENVLRKLQSDQSAP